MNAIGILGGMGPESTAYTYMEMVRFCQKEYGANLDGDFPPMVIYSLPVPDVVEGGAEAQEVRRMLEFGVDTLKAAGAGFGFIACNSMEAYVPALRRRMEMLSIVEETVAEARKARFRTLGILATRTTLKNNAYQKALDEAGINWLLPEDQGAVTLAIRQILEGKKTEPKERIVECIQGFSEQGADGVVLGCTDLPVAISQKDSGIPLLDSAAIVGRAAIKKYYMGK